MQPKMCQKYYEILLFERWRLCQGCTNLIVSPGAWGVSAEGPLALKVTKVGRWFHALFLHRGLRLCVSRLEIHRKRCAK